ncbi:MAG TPA: BatD family protein, partial [Polyangia bacterium]
MSARLAVLASLLVGSAAFGQRVQLQLESREIYAQVPFVLALLAEEFDEQPAPEQPRLTISGCEVTPLGATPQVQQMLQIINGRQSVSRSVTWSFRYRVTAPATGTYQVPALTVVQGARRAATQPATFHANVIGQTRDMKVRLNLPARSVMVGETFALTLDWLIRRDVSEQSFTVPLFDQVDRFEVAPAPAQGRRALALQLGSRRLELPFDRSSDVVDGVQYTRLRLHALVTPLKAGTLDVPPTSVVATVGGGMGGFFGLGMGRGQLVKAQDVPRRLEVAALPQAGRPRSFNDAVGEAFALSVRAARTVVRVGDPLELELTVRGKARLEGLRLPRLDTAGLDPAVFAVPADVAPGEIIEEGAAKRFRVTVRLKAAAREIPRLAFSYYDATKRTYETVHSEPIALQVAGSAVVGAGDVVAAAPAPATPGPKRPEAAPGGGLSLVGADLALSAEPRTLARPLG